MKNRLRYCQNRLTEGLYTGTLAEGISTTMYNGTQGYDKNGNIGYLKRTTGSGATVMDELIYSYTANQLTAVADGGDATKGFKDKVNTTDYTYDQAGNMITDANKDLSIAYNHLNLPANITRNTIGGSTNGIVKHFYAGATKVRMETYDAAGTTLVKAYDYLAGMVYQETVTAGTSTKELDFVASSEGRALLTKKVLNLTTDPTTGDKFRFEYSLKDHLGNLRVSCRCGEPKRDAQGIIIPEGTAGAGIETLSVVQEQHYDAWGLAFTQPTGTGLEDRFKFLGREEQPETGWMDLMQRMYDPPTARFLSVDPKPDVEGQESLTTYQYGYNNPIRYSDPNGDCPTCVTAGIGALIKGGIELGGQLISNGGNFNDVDWADVGVEAGKGAFAGSGAGLFAIAAAEVGGALVKGSIDIKTGSGSKNVFDGSKTKKEAAFDAVTDYAAGKIGDVGAKKIGGVIGGLAKKTEGISNTANKALSIAKNYVKETVSDQTRNQGAKQYVKVLTKEATVANAKKQATATSSAVVKSSAGNVANEGFQNKAIDYVKSFFNF